MQKILLLILGLPLLTLGYSQDSKNDFYDQLALHWAPIHYQSIRTSDGIFNNNALNGKSDSLSQIDFDGDWNATNNWENLETNPITPSVYYYVAATETHYYITYGYFHARDWTRFNFFHFAQHENDLEGIMLVIEKDSSKFGKLILGYSIFHLSIQRFFYNEDVIITNNFTRYKAGNIEHNNHPASYQQPRGHGVKLDNSFYKPKKPHCRYIPENVNTTTKQDVKYNLIDFLAPDGYLDQKESPCFLYEDGALKGSHGEGAKSPWLWKDHKDKKTNPDTQLFTDPAKYVLIDCSFNTPFSTEYIHHPFLKLEVNK